VSGLPTITIKLDDGTGTFPYDVSTYVRLVDGITFTHGRENEYGEIQPGTCGLTFDNTDGRFSLGSTIINATSPIFVDNQIRVSYTVGGVLKDRFTGYVQTWPVEWPDGGDTFAVAKITAVDVLARLARRPLRSIIEEEFLLDSPAAYYTLGEPAGATVAGDTSGNGGQALGQSGSGTAVVFGNATGPSTDALTAAQFTNGGKSLQSQTPQAALATGVSSFALECFFSATAIGGSGGLLIDAITASLGIDGSGNLFVQNSSGGAQTSGPSYVDGTTHHVLGYYNGANMILYVDGVLAATNAATGTMTVYPINGIGVSGAAGLIVTGVRGGSITGVIAHAALYLATPSATRITAHANAGLNGFNTDRSDQRISRYLVYGGVPTASQVLEAGVQTNVPHYDITGNSVAGAVAKVNEGEVGVVFARGDGKVVFHNRQHRQLKTTADWTLTAIDLDPGTVVPADMQQVTNIATSSRAGGATQAAQSASSITKHGQYPASYDSLLVTTDAQALDRINWQVGTHAEPGARFNQLQIDLLTASQTLQQNAQARELGDRLSITGLPSQAPAGLADQIIEGWTETLTAASWDMTFNTSPWGLEQAWILGDATYGVLGSTTRLGF
jgi:hypothetical protein